VQTVFCDRSPCSFYIPTPETNTGARPIPLKYYFVVFVSIGPYSFGSKPSNSVVVKFWSTTTPSPTPTPTPTPTPSSPSIRDFDGNYSGTLNVSLTPALISPRSIPFTLQILNGTGQGRGGGWTGTGYVTDAQGTASITVSNALYGDFTFPISFNRSLAAQTKTISGSGSRTMTHPDPGIGELTFNFTLFVISTK